MAEAEVENISENSFAKFFMHYFLPIFTFFVFVPVFGIIKICIVISLLVQKIFCSNETTEEIHAQKVQHVQDQVIEWNQNGRKTQMCSARPARLSLSTRPANYKGRMTQIQVDLGHIIGNIHEEKQIVRVEPLVRMGRLSSYLLKRGWIVPVIPEFNDLTVDGLVCGTGIESSCHKYGLFQDICVAFEVVLADGRVVNCSKDENVDLFHSIPMSHGTLGFLTSATLMIIPAKKYVELEYIPAPTLDDAVSMFESHAHSDNDFLEGIMFGIDKGVIIVGKMSNEAEPGKVNSIGRWYKQWFYKHAESFLEKPRAPAKEWISLRDYLHRHNKSSFWEANLAFPFAKKLMFRWLLGWILPLRYSFYLMMTPVPLRRITDNVHVLQDFMVPISKLKECLTTAHEETGSYPLWLCPSKMLPTPRLLSAKGEEEEMYVDLGIYGLTRVKGYNLEATGKRLEAMCLKNGGYQFLYADVFLTRDEFEKMFNHELYFKMRKELRCEDAFPEIYDKVCRAAKRH